jgi:hypothetical protein
MVAHQLTFIPRPSKRYATNIFGARPMQSRSLWSGVLIVAFATLALTWLILAYAGAPSRRGMPPDLLPRIGAWLMLLGGVGLSIVSGMRAIGAGGLMPAGFGARTLWSSAWPFLYVGLAVVAMTQVKITWIGAPMIVGFLLLLGERRLAVLALCSAAPVALLYVPSAHLMRVGVV